MRQLRQLQIEIPAKTLRAFPIPCSYSIPALATMPAELGHSQYQKTTHIAGLSGIGSGAGAGSGVRLGIWVFYCDIFIASTLSDIELSLPPAPPPIPCLPPAAAVSLPLPALNAHRCRDRKFRAAFVDFLSPLRFSDIFMFYCLNFFISFTLSVCLSLSLFPVQSLKFLNIKVI